MSGRFAGGPFRPPAPPAAHGAHLLAQIVSGADGTRTATCPVCSTSRAVPSAGGWVPLICVSCGTEYVASDGSPPPAPPTPPPPVRSPLAPTAALEPRHSDADAPRGFTSDVSTTPDGRRLVACPRCHSAELAVPPGATVGVVLRCPACNWVFLVSLDGGTAADRSPATTPAPVAPRRPPVTPRPAKRWKTTGPDDAPVAVIVGTGPTAWAACPACRSPVSAPGEPIGWVWLRCNRCGAAFRADSSRAPKPAPARVVPPPRPPSLWRRMREWFGG